MSLVQPLPAGALDIVGDIHGEYFALEQLLAHLGYDHDGNHPEGRRLVFVGDFCDRGPDSPSVLNLVGGMLASGKASGVLGNHEINLLREDAKDGSGWFFDSRVDSDRPKYGSFARMPEEQVPSMLRRLNKLPIALEREDLRIVHAAWRPEQIAMARQLPTGSARESYDHFEGIAAERSVVQRIAQRMREEDRSWPHSLEDYRHAPPFLPAHSESELSKAMVNPLKVNAATRSTRVANGALSSAWAGGTNTTKSPQSSSATTGVACTRPMRRPMAHSSRISLAAPRPCPGTACAAMSFAWTTPSEPAGWTACAAMTPSSAANSPPCAGPSAP